MAPARLIRPYVGRSPETRQRMLGETMEPRVSVPTEKPTSPAAVAAAEPALLPLEPCLGFHGFLVVPLNQTSPIANAPMLSLAIMIAPAACSFLTTVQSKSKTWSE